MPAGYADACKVHMAIVCVGRIRGHSKIVAVQVFVMV